MTEKNQTGASGLEPYVIDLVNRGVDGDLSAREQQQLDQLMAESESVTALYNEMMAVTGILDDTPAREPPEHLLASIERQVRLPVPDGRSRRAKNRFGSILSAAWLRTGFAMAAMAVIAVGIYQLGSTPLSTEDDHNMSGTIARAPVDRPAPYRFELQDELISGRVEVTAIEDAVTLQITLDASSPSEVLIDFGKSGLEFQSIHQQVARKDEYSVKHDVMRISGSGEQDYIVKFRRLQDAEKDEPIQVDFFANKSLVQSAQISVKQP